MLSVPGGSPLPCTARPTVPLSPDTKCGMMPPSRKHTAADPCMRQQRTGIVVSGRWTRRLTGQTAAHSSSRLRQGGAQAGTRTVRLAPISTTTAGTTPPAGALFFIHAAVLGGRSGGQDGGQS